jgi:anion-transporting  ArsA/GET3 family ATPase
VLALVGGGQYDLIVVDTPPAQHALDFFQAPERVLAFLDQRVVRWFLLPYSGAGWSTARWVGRLTRGLVERVEQAASIATLTQASDLFANLVTMLTAFKGSAAALQKLLRAPTTARVLVASAEHRSLAEAARFAQEMRRLNLPPTAVVLNRLHPQPETSLLGASGSAGGGAMETALRDLLARAGVAEDWVRWVVENAASHARLAQRERDQVDVFLGQHARGLPVFRLLRLEHDVHDLGGLRALIRAEATH